MQPTLCNRCKINVAVVFLTKLENGVTSSEGLCLPCAREMGIQPMNDLIKRMGITDEDLDALTREMTEALSNPQELMNLASIDHNGAEEEEDGKTATFPFLNRLFSSMPPGEAPEGQPGPRPPRDERRENGAGKRKFLENYCISLTQRAKENKLDR
ncbi:MAG: ATP-dependent Clp protease ATP-binding subunit, partial [Oscillospiraceae bacterium]|nr:ATP-dependent Clp protease ATP-binding subunit [Oscillospiraceae bacterium]